MSSGLQDIFKLVLITLSLSYYCEPPLNHAVDCNQFAFMFIPVKLIAIRQVL